MTVRRRGVSVLSPILWMESSACPGTRGHDPVNIGNPSEMTIKQFAEKILEKIGGDSTIEFRPLPEDDPKVRQPDITLAKRLLQWEPKVPFDEGITKTIDYFRGGHRREVMSLFAGLGKFFRPWRSKLSCQGWCVRSKTTCPALSCRLSHHCVTHLP